MSKRALLLVVPLVTGLGGLASAQPADDVTIDEEPTGGVRLPAVALAGNHDATAVSVNPAGLHFLGGAELALAFDIEDEDDATTSGPGFGFYYGQVLGGKLLPRLGLGLGIEVPRASRVRLAPDPGTPTRLTLASSLPLGQSAALGLAWRRFFDDDMHTLSGVSSWDAGFSGRFGTHFAAGAVVRDLFAPTVAGEEVQRRYELELITRPVATDRLELGFGGRIGEERGDVDGWLRWSVKVVRGLYFNGEVGTRELRVVDLDPSGNVRELDRREYQLTAGFEVSFGGLGVASYGSGVLDESEDARFGSGTLLVKISQRPPASIMPEPKRIEKLEISGSVSGKEHTLMVAKLRSLRRDPGVVALLVKLDGIGLGWAAAREIRNELLALRERGVKVLAFMITGGSRDYFVASAADRVYVDPAGDIRLSGFAATILYFKGMFDELGVNAEFERIAEYKSAPEAFTRTGPSAPAREMRDALYDSLYGTLVDDIAASRNLSASEVRKLIDEGPYAGGELEGSPLVDAVATPDELDKVVANELGGRYPVSSRQRTRNERWSYPELAVIHVEGDIVDGKSQTIPLIGRKSAGSETLVDAIRQARGDSDVVAIVLRIDSPGGSALASEIIAREVFKTRKVKPIICSMGDIAASGGYFIAAGCDTILADPMTITGSIGIFFGKFDVSALASRLGLSWTTWKRGERADIASMFRPLTDEERVFFKERLRYFYGRFIDTVADGRDMSTDEVDEVGRGRVWTGAAAKPIDLVDRFGGISDAITLAKERAGLADGDLVQLRLLPRAEKSLLGSLTGLPIDGADEQAVSPLSLIPGVGRLVRSLPPSLVLQPDAPQARLPFEIIFE